MHYVLFYDYAPDYLTRREQFRNEHLKLAWAAHERGEFMMGGVLADPIDSAMLLFNVDSPKVIEDFVALDPYVSNGLVLKWRIRPWNTVAGDLANNPVRPA
jgi:uncharacterized protein YciI